MSGVVIHRLRTRLAQARRSRALRAEIERLIAGDEIAILNPLLASKSEDPAAQEVAKDVVADFVQTYGAVTPRNVPELPGGSVLLGHPLGLLAIPSTHEEYLDRVGPKTRNIIRKASKTGYEFREFAWNDHLDDVFRINTSIESRSGGPMRGWYTQPVEPREAEELKTYYGAFQGERLYGYLHLVVCGDFGFFRHFLGHSDHLNNGIMNGLISWTVDRHAGDRQMRWLKYGPLVTGGDSMSAFKRHAGFAPYATFLELGRLEDDPVGEL
jgi:hypothetical protein